jgi:hypothetical protein
MALVKLGWDDLLIQHFTAADADRWLGEWAGHLKGEAAPLSLSRFGSWFLLRREGHVEMLDVVSGTIGTVAASNAEFLAFVNTPQWQEQHLLSLLVYQLHCDGLVAANQQCYMLVPHPRIGGPNPMAGDPVETQQVMVVDPVVCQSLCAQMVSATGGLQQL